MKKVYVFAILVLTMLTAGNLFAQGYAPLFNQTWEIYTKTYLATTANDTTRYFALTRASFGKRDGTEDMRFFGRSNDSLAVDCYYQLKNSTTGALGTWTQIDTVIHVNTSDSTSTPGTLLRATLIGYDQIRFYFDWLTGSAASDGSTNTFRFYLYLLKNEDD